MLVGKIGRLPKRLHNVTTTKRVVPEEENKHEELKLPTSLDIPATQAENMKALLYQEPSWSGLPEVTQNEYTLEVGHMLKLGCSTRTYLLNGPAADTEEESELSLTELKEKRLEELRRREQQKEKEEELRKKQEERGIDWGLGEDADEETDLSENPYAEANNEELYIDNPKKALRGFFEREGLDLEYDCSEQGIGQFLCKVELPIDDEMGRPIFAEVFHKGKKKEAVVQCALEACRILDRHGLLRQATHESRKRKPKNWEENDYYDSDDDTFLDRTGSIEKKREMRMNAKAPQKAETYENLNLEMELADAQRKLASQDVVTNAETDPLDSFMMELKKSKPSKQSVNKLKLELNKLKQEHSNVIKLVNITKPASLPPLVAEYLAIANTSSSEKKALPLIGKRRKIKLQLSAKSTEMTKIDAEGVDEEMEEEKEEDHQKQIVEISAENVEKTESIVENVETKMDNEENGKDINSSITNSDMKKETSDDIDEKKKKRNQRRLQQKQERAEVERQKGYAEDHHREDYNMWIPPADQTGDGRTALNDKYGY
ncbi:kanadaptin [Asbolus verrucosus]|uniref:Kanadaptin n=1 Tax=Asbolus verrucosus TaxID=1661398 RepID=A0A482VJ48_ASBVE|nr:kanadaptin [Asbolus verrucosus]